MTSNPESQLFDFAGSKRKPETEDEKMVTDIHAALGFDTVPLRLRKPPAVQPSRSWGQYFPVAAAVLLVISLLGASFSTLAPDGKDGDQFASVPPVVLGVASPVASACDFTGDVPFFSGANESPIDGPTVLLTQDENLVLACDGDNKVLLGGVKVAGPTMTPHVMIAITENANHLLNVVTGAQIEIPNGGPQAQTSIGQQLVGPWVLSSSIADISTTSLYELTSMTEIPVVTTNGESVIIADLESAVVSSRMDRIAIAIPDDPDSMNATLTGFFITNLTGESRFLAVDSMPMPRQIAISPDGLTIATSSYEGTTTRGTTKITIINAEDGAVEQSWEFPTRNQSSELTWLHDGSMLILTDGTKLLGITPESSREGIRVFATADMMQGIFLTSDDKVVAISQSETDVSTTPDTRTLFVNVESGTITSQPGSDPWSSPNFSPTRTTLILAQPKITRGGDNPNLLVVDAATGEKLGEIDIDLSIESSFQSSTWGYGEGDIVTLAFGPDSMWLLVDADGNATLQHIAPPPLEDADYQAVSLVISPDGFMGLRTFEPFSAWFKAPASEEWVQIDLPDPGSGNMMLPSIQFVIGDD